MQVNTGMIWSIKNGTIDNKKSDKREECNISQGHCLQSFLIHSQLFI